MSSPADAGHHTKGLDHTKESTDHIKESTDHIKESKDHIKSLRTKSMDHMKKSMDQRDSAGKASLKLTIFWLAHEARTERTGVAHDKEASREKAYCILGGRAQQGSVTQAYRILR